jgi:D-alanyl-D-alanine carboxypeptidase
LAGFCTQRDIPGATCAFVLPDGRLGAVAVGVSSRTTGQAMEPTNRMLAGSVGKTFVAAVLLQLHAEGRVDLDEKISHWLGQEAWFARLPNGPGITLRMLLNHTSGLEEYYPMEGFINAVSADLQRAWQPGERIAYILDRPALFPAGQGWSYADTNFLLVGMIIEKVTGRTYYEELTRRILRPRDLQDTIPSDRNPLPGLVSGYTTPDHPFPVPAEITKDGFVAMNPQMEWTGGGVLSNAPDLARWARMLYAGDVLPPAERTLMLAGVPTQRWPNVDYGLGVLIRRTPHGIVYGHSGWFPGYITMMGWYAGHELALAVQFNSDVGMSSEALSGLTDDLAGVLLAKLSGLTAQQRAALRAADGGLGQ